MVVFLWRVAHTAGNTFDEYCSSPYKQGGFADVVIDVLEICIIHIYIYILYMYICIAACTIHSSSWSPYGHKINIILHCADILARDGQVFSPWIPLDMQPAQSSLSSVDRADDDQLDFLVLISMKWNPSLVEAEEYTYTIPTRPIWFCCCCCCWCCCCCCCCCCSLRPLVRAHFFRRTPQWKSGVYVHFVHWACGFVHLEAGVVFAHVLCTEWYTAWYTHFAHVQRFGMDCFGTYFTHAQTCTVM